MYDANELFYVERHHLERMNKLALRLFTENRMNGDEMRDAAQLLHSVCFNSVSHPDGREFVPFNSEKDL